MDFSIEGLKNLSSSVVQILKHLQFGTKAQLAFLEDLYVLINDGIPANRAIEMMAQITSGITQEVAISLSEKIAQGQPLAEGMREWFAMNVVEIIRVGEAGGALAQAMKSAINMLSQKGVAMGAFIGAISYPLLVIASACIIIVYLNDTVFVQFKQIKPIAQWPSAGLQFMNLAQLIKDWWWIIILLIIAVILSLRWLMLNYVGELRPMLDAIPPFNFYRRFTAGRLLETMGLLVSNGVVFKSAIKIMQYYANPYLSSHLVMMEHLLSMGKTNVAEVLDTGLVSESDLMRLRVMAEVKGFEHGLIRMGLRGTEETTATIKLISRIFGGVFLAIGAGLIMVIIRGIYLTGMAMGQQ